MKSAMQGIIVKVTFYFRYFKHGIAINVILSHFPRKHFFKTNNRFAVIVTELDNSTQFRKKQLQNPNSITQLNTKKTLHVPQMWNTLHESVVPWH